MLPVLELYCVFLAKPKQKLKFNPFNMGKTKTQKKALLAGKLLGGVLVALLFAVLSFGNWFADGNQVHLSADVLDPADAEQSPSVSDDENLDEDAPPSLTTASPALVREQMRQSSKLEGTPAASQAFEALEKLNDVSEKRREAIARAMDNVSIGFSGEKLDDLLRDKTRTIGAAAALREVLLKNVDKLPDDAVENMERVIEFSSVRNFSSAGADEAERALETIRERLADLPPETEEWEDVGDRLEQLLSDLDELYENDKSSQLIEGRLPFEDLHRGEEAWFFGYAVAAKAKTLLTGEPVNGVMKMNPERAINQAEALALAARAVAGGLENIPEDVDMENPLVANQPDWARNAATYLAARGVDLEAIFEDAPAWKKVTRVQMMELIARALDLESDDHVVLDNFPDRGLVRAHSRSAVAGLVLAGLIEGDTLPDGSKKLNPENLLNRAAFVKIVVEALNLAE